MHSVETIKNIQKIGVLFLVIKTSHDSNERLFTDSELLSNRFTFGIIRVKPECIDPIGNHVNAIRGKSSIQHQSVSNGLAGDIDPGHQKAIRESGHQAGFGLHEPHMRHDGPPAARQES